VPRATGVAFKEGATFAYVYPFAVDSDSLLQAVAEVCGEAAAVKPPVWVHLLLQGGCAFFDADGSFLAVTHFVRTKAEPIERPLGTAVVSENVVRSNVRPLFDQIDVDGDGKLSVDEMRMLLRELKLPIASVELEALVKAADVDNDVRSHTTA
jgi:hypothetical protein